MNGHSKNLSVGEKGLMSGFQRGGYRAAREAIIKDYETLLEGLHEKLAQVNPTDLAKRGALLEEIDQYKHEFREALVALKRSLY